MADIIRITASEIEGIAAQFTNAAEQNEDLLKTLSNAVDSLSSGWEGDAHQKFVSNFEEIHGQLTSITALYNGLSEQLKGVVAGMQQADAEIAASLG